MQRKLGCPVVVHDADRDLGVGLQDIGKSRARRMAHLGELLPRVRTQEPAAAILRWPTTLTREDLVTQEADKARTVLPVPDPPHGEITATDAKDPEAKFPPIEPLRPPDGAPNVLIVLLDDVGFAASSAFGGPCSTPTAERLAAGGLKFNRFHTTALCSPTRQALLTGRNHHTAAWAASPRSRPPPPGTTPSGRIVRSAGRGAEAERILDRAVRQMPRGPGVGDEPARSVRCLAIRRRWLRALLRLHRWRDESVLPGSLRRAPFRSSRRRRPRRATTSPRT